MSKIVEYRCHDCGAKLEYMGTGNEPEGKEVVYVGACETCREQAYSQGYADGSSKEAV